MRRRSACNKRCQVSNSTSWKMMGNPAEAVLTHSFKIGLDVILASSKVDLFEKCVGKGQSTGQAAPVVQQCWLAHLLGGQQGGPDSQWQRAQMRTQNSEEWDWQGVHSLHSWSHLKPRVAKICHNTQPKQLRPGEMSSLANPCVLMCLTVQTQNQCIKFARETRDPSQDLHFQ